MNYGFSRKELISFQLLFPLVSEKLQVINSQYKGLAQMFQANAFFLMRQILSDVKNQEYMLSIEGFSILGFLLRSAPIFCLDFMFLEILQDFPAELTIPG